MGPFDPNATVNIPGALLGGVAFTFAGWYHFACAQDICERMASGARRIPFLARHYRSRGCYLTMRIGGVVCIALGLFVLFVGLWHVVL